MKKLLTITFVTCLIFISCKKDRVCNCTVTTVGTNNVHTVTPGFPPLLPTTDTTISSPIYSVNTIKTTYTKVSKKAMRSNCYSKSDETFNESSSNSVPGLFEITTTQMGTRSYSCKVE